MFKDINIFLLFALSIISFSLHQAEGSLLQSSAYSSWLDARGSNYSHSERLANEEDPKVIMHWSIVNDKIKLAVAGTARGYLAVGLAEAGGMPGSDIVALVVAPASSEDEQPLLLDMYATAYSTPLEDECQDWVLTQSPTVDMNEGVIIWEAERLLDTGDEQDRVFMDDSDSTHPGTKVIAAWGSSPYNVAGLTYHGANRLQDNLRFFASGAENNYNKIFHTKMNAESEGSIILRASNYTMKPMVTEYFSICFNMDDLFAQGFPRDQQAHIIGIEPIIDRTENIHHMLIYGDGAPLSAFVCEIGGHIVGAFAKGNGPYLFPDEAGLRIGDATSMDTFKLEIHYDNPDQLEGLVDSSGFKIYYTTSLREYDVGVLQVGDPAVSLTGELVGEGLQEYTFTCPASCTSAFFDENVTVYGEWLHMHAVGTAMTSKIFRDGYEVHEGRVDFYDFDQVGGYTVPESAFTIEKGDSFEVKCTYDASVGTEFGMGSNDEMCISYYMYYPKQPIPWGLCGYKLMSKDCSTSLISKSLVDDSEIGRIFGEGNNGVCSVTEPPSSTSSPSSTPNKIPTLIPTSNYSEKPVFSTEPSFTSVADSGSDMLIPSGIDIISLSIMPILLFLCIQ